MYFLLSTFHFLLSRVMHQTIYIDVDEEITSILDRIRQEVTIDIFLIVPKGAMLLNSIINLKLLKKETEKMGKTVSIVSPNDPKAKIMIERAGIKAEDYNRVVNEQELQKASIEKPIETEQITQAISDSLEETEQQITQHSTNIGSSAFFSGNRQPQVTPVTNQNTNSYNQSQQDQLGSQETNSQNIPKIETQNNNEQYSQKQQTQQFNNYNEQNQNYSQDNKLNYFNQKSDNQDNKAKGKSGGLFKNKILLIGASIFVIALLGIGGWYMSNYPKLSLNIRPLNNVIDEEISVVAKDGLSEVDVKEKTIPGEYLEMPLTKTMEFKTTGEKVFDKNGAKAKGVVTIENTFSNKPQKLVKTTRILSKDGKLFRLSKGVIVPGMTDNSPGKIEVAVEADKPGKEFNINKGEFVIAAWKGTPKGEKFKVTSTDAMKGGVTSADSKTQKVVSKTDLDKARKQTLQALDESLEGEIQKRLNSDQQVVMSSIEKEIISSKSSHLVDTITDKFTYTVTYKVKMMSFKTEDIKRVAKEAVRRKVGKNYELDQNFKLEATRGIVDFDKKTITIYVDIKGLAWFKIDEDKLKKAIAGQDAETTKKALSQKAGIKSAEIKPSPSWSSKSPSDLDKITIKIVK